MVADREITNIACVRTLLRRKQAKTITTTTLATTISRHMRDVWSREWVINNEAVWICRDKASSASDRSSCTSLWRQASVSHAVSSPWHDQAPACYSSRRSVLDVAGWTTTDTRTPCVVVWNRTKRTCYCSRYTALAFHCFVTWPEYSTSKVRYREHIGLTGWKPLFGSTVTVHRTRGQRSDFLVWVIRM